MDEILGQIVLEHDFREYKTFFGHAWARRLYATVKGTKLEPLVAALCVNWKSAANTHMFPWLMVESMNAAVTRMNGGRKLISREQLWRHFHLEDPKMSEMHLAIFGSQRLCYVAIYFAYETFVRETLAIFKGVEEFRELNFRDVKKAANECFTKEVADACLDKVVDDARRIRNAIAHNGGKLGKNSNGNIHGIRIEGGTLQVMPHDSRKLIRELEGRVEKLVEAALKRNEFKLSAAS